MIEFEFLSGTLDFYREDEDGDFIKERGVTGLSCISENKATISIAEILKAAGWAKYGDWYVMEELNRTIDREIAHIIGAATDNAAGDERAAMHFEDAGAWARR